MANSKNSYRQVMKATSLFGGVQVFNILIRIVRSKVIALLIGPAGMGIATLLNSTFELVNGLTSFGLDRSAVKDISLVNNKSDSLKVSRIVSVLKRLVWYTITIGALVMIIASPILSELAFENKEYSIHFIWLSVALIFKQLSSSQLAILQGLRKLKNLAKANLLGNILGLIITLPLYYYFGVDAIVPAIIVATLMSFLLTYYYTRKLGLPSNKLSGKEAFTEGKGMIQLGLMLSLSSMFKLLVAYMVRVFISQEGGIAEVGLFGAGIVILDSYVGIIFNAMGTDYFPRLAAISEKIKKIRKTVFEQALIAVLLITPIIIIFLTFAPYIIIILYSNEFSPIISMVSWGILGMLFKAVSWSVGYVIIAKGDSSVFLKTAIGFNSILLLFNILGYHYGGLEGLGFSFLIYYIVHFISIKIITYYRYNFYFEKGFYSIFIFCSLLCGISFLLQFINVPLLKYGLMSGMIILSFIYSLYHLDKRMNLKELIYNFYRKKND